MIIKNVNEIERIVFVDQNGEPTGQTGPKIQSHNRNTRLHLAFSCYIFRSSDKAFLFTRRALSKKVWPGVWTNSVCGHPFPTEAIERAIVRRAEYELGLQQLDGLSCLVPNYRYKTPPFDGVVEHEFCPIYFATTHEDPKLNPLEVEEFTWITWREYQRMIQEQEDVSWWAKDQLKIIRSSIDQLLQQL
jgi:isopentenyl-diphosphate Delta-isomerase